MLIRIVRLSFKKENVSKFLEIFNESKNKIRCFEGCEHVELLQDYSNNTIFSTYSIWKDEVSLNKYRQSELFESVWSRTKVLFNDKPVAHSFKKYEV